MKMFFLSSIMVMELNSIVRFDEILLVELSGGVYKRIFVCNCIVYDLTIHIFKKLAQYYHICQPHQQDVNVFSVIA